jgi:hypothetical protein
MVWVEVLICDQDCPAQNQGLSHDGSQSHHWRLSFLQKVLIAGSQGILSANRSHGR